jgi:hypothetical protein
VESESGFDTSSDLAPSRVPTPPPSREHKFKIRLKTNALGPNGIKESHVRRRSGRLSGQEDVNYYDKAREALGLVNRGGAKRQANDCPSTPPLVERHNGRVPAAIHTPDSARKFKKIKISSYVAIFFLQRATFFEMFTDY